MVIISALMLLAAFDGTATETQSTQPAKDAERMICKKFAVTGSLVARRKVCHTAAQWGEMVDAGNAGARRLVEDNAGKPSLSN